MERVSERQIRGGIFRANLTFRTARSRDFVQLFLYQSGWFWRCRPVQGTSIMECRRAIEASQTGVAWVGCGHVRAGFAHSSEFVMVGGGSIGVSAAAGGGDIPAFGADRAALEWGFGQQRDRRGTGTGSGKPAGRGIRGVSQGGSGAPGIAETRAIRGLAAVAARAGHELVEFLMGGRLRRRFPQICAFSLFPIARTAFLCILTAPAAFRERPLNPPYRPHPFRTAKPLSWQTFSLAGPIFCH